MLRPPSSGYSLESATIVNSGNRRFQRVLVEDNEHLEMSCLFNALLQLVAEARVLVELDRSLVVLVYKQAEYRVRLRVLGCFGYKVVEYLNREAFLFRAGRLAPILHLNPDPDDDRQRKFGVVVLSRPAPVRLG